MIFPSIRHLESVLSSYLPAWMRAWAEENTLNYSPYRQAYACTGTWEAILETPT